MEAVAESDNVKQLKKAALVSAHHCFVKIRVLTELLQARENVTDEQRRQVVLAINKLADGAHNLPTLVDLFGSNDWASEETIAQELNICREAFAESRAIEEAVFYPERKKA